MPTRTFLGGDDDKKTLNNDRGNPVEPTEIGEPDRATESVTGSLHDDIKSQVL